jgi:hypothetical protein
METFLCVGKRHTAMISPVASIQRTWRHEDMNLTSDLLVHEQARAAFADWPRALQVKKCAAQRAMKI